MAASLDPVAHAACARDGFTFVRAVGEGVFKETFEVVLPDGAHVALKVYKPGHPHHRTGREIDALQRCAHVAIAKLFTLGTMDWGGTTYLLSIEEFIGGGTLASRLVNDTTLAPSDIRVVGSQLIDAVAHIASLGLVHRDLKPDNILFRDSGLTPVIVDFGLVRNLAEGSLTNTWLLQGPGTPFYAPAEQLTNDKDMIDWRSDQFSLGVLLSVAALGLHPYAEPGDSRPETIERVAMRREPSKSFVTAANTAGLAPLVKMVAPWPVQRYRIPAELQSAWDSP
jgi:serine/threonine protein kinase